jgi:hypothetical protein
MLTDDESVTPEEFIEVLDLAADAASYTRGKGLGKAYEITKNVSKSVGFTKDDLKRITMSETGGQVHDLKKIKSKLFKDKLPDKDEFPDEREEAQEARNEKLAEEGQKVKDQYPHIWEDIVEQAKIPKAVQYLIR